MAAIAVSDFWIHFKHNGLWISSGIISCQLNLFMHIFRYNN